MKSRIKKAFELLLKETEDRIKKGANLEYNSILYSVSIELDRMLINKMEESNANSRTNILPV